MMKKILSIRNINFSDIDILALDSGSFDFIIADLGISSMQIDNPERGFTYKHEGPLDLRMDPNKGIPASLRLKELSEIEIEGMLTENSDEPYADKIAHEIISAYRQGHMIDTTTELYQVIQKALAFLPKDQRDDAIKKSSQRTFQALRIDVNHEFESLYAFLEKLPDVLSAKGKVAILSFHSGEDRLVKKIFSIFSKTRDLSRSIRWSPLDHLWKNKVQIVVQGLLNLGGLLKPNINKSDVHVHIALFFRFILTNKYL